MACEDDPPRVDSQSGCVGRRAQIFKDRSGVLWVLSKAEVAGTAPRAAVVERYRVPARAPRRLGEIEILLVARQSVEDHDRRVKSDSRSLVDHAVDQQAGMDCARAAP